MNEKGRTVFVCSDSVGETAEKVVQATVRQFSAFQTKIRRFSRVKSEEEIVYMMEEAAKERSFVAYTLVLPELREMIREEAARLHIIAVDIMGPVMQAFIDVFNDSPRSKPGLLHQLDEEYYRRVDAVEFTVKSDDGKDMNAIRLADLVLIGVSRTSKTPLSLFLAHKGYKVCNYPIVPDVAPPMDLFRENRAKLVGLTMDAGLLAKIRFERLKAMGLPSGSSYASIERIARELEYSRHLFDKLGCMVIDVTERAVEETAGIILEAYY